MTDPAVPPEVRSLLFDSVETFEELEVLMLLHNDTSRHWTARAITEAIGLPSDRVAPALDALVTHRLIERLMGGSASEYRFDTNSQRAAVVDALAACWAAQRYDIARLLGMYAMERVRNSAARAFADAFVLGRRKRDG